jgi:hypothetical protein
VIDDPECQPKHSHVGDLTGKEKLAIIMGFDGLCSTFCIAVVMLAAGRHSLRFCLYQRYCVRGRTRQDSRFEVLMQV